MEKLSWLIYQKKNVTERLASAISSITMNKETLNMIKNGSAKKGCIRKLQELQELWLQKKPLN